MSKCILVDAYLLVTKKNDYSLSFRRWTGDQSGPLPMLFVRRVDICGVKHYIYKADVNQMVSTKPYDNNVVFLFSMMYTDGLHYFDNSLAYLERQWTYLDRIIDADGKITMSQHIPGNIYAPVGERSYLFRFTDPSVVSNNNA